MDYDLVVIGGGAAGLGAARTAVARGASVALVADGAIGGECTFTGCIPSKTLIEQAAAGAAYTDAIGRVHATVEQVAATEDAEALTAAGITVLAGHGRLAGPGRVVVDGRPIGTRRVIIATGSTPYLPPIDGLADTDHLTTDTIFTLDRLPASLVILGGGAVGCELAQAYARFGGQVTIVEAAGRLLPSEDADAAAVLTRRLTGQRITIRTSARVQHITGCGRVTLAAADGTTIRADRLLVATGRRVSTEGLGLDSVGIEPGEHGHVRVNDRMATAAAGVYAAGDVTGLYDFTHAADAMARVAAANALSRRPMARFRTDAIPRVVFTDPEVAHVGVTEAQAAARGGLVCYLPMTEVDRAITAGRTEGFVKLITAPARLTRRLGGGRIVGATIVAPRAGELIAEPALALRTGMFAGRLAQTTHAYPTWSHAVQLAAAQLIGHGRRPYRARRSNREE